ncbi:beta-ketoacyl synthase N-terminal-like domain-containing protein [Kosakonia sp. H02]|nr:beta-ketoacyl synthase N-terminal-like domain-containing protein [Kosakonia sp. H02]
MENAPVIAGYSIFMPYAKSPHQLIENLKQGVCVNKEPWFRSNEEAIKCGFSRNRHVARLETLHDGDFKLIFRLIDETLAQARLKHDCLSGENVRVYLTGLGPRVDVMDYKSFYDNNDIEDITLTKSLRHLHVRNMSQDHLAFQIAKRYGLKYIPPNMHCTSNSSLAAAHLGCQAIEQGGIDLVCIVNCSKIKTQDIWFLESQSMLDSEVVQPFGKNGKAVLFAEGLAVMLLERNGYRRARNMHGGIRLSSAYMQISANRSNDMAWLSANMLKVMRTVLNQADITLQDLCAIIPHGNGSSNTDKAEAKAITMLMGEQSVPVLAYKGQLGYTATGSGIIDLIIGDYSVRHCELLTPVSNDAIIDDLANHVLLDQGVITHNKQHLLKIGLGVDGSIIGMVMSALPDAQVKI